MNGFWFVPDIRRDVVRVAGAADVMTVCGSRGFGETYVTPRCGVGGNTSIATLSLYNMESGRVFERNLLPRRIT